MLHFPVPQHPLDDFLCIYLPVGVRVLEGLFAPVAPVANLTSLAFLALSAWFLSDAICFFIASLSISNYLRSLST